MRLELALEDAFEAVPFEEAREAREEAREALEARDEARELAFDEALEP